MPLFMDSDVDVSRWVIELLLRDREKECSAKRVLAVAPFSDQDYRLKKTVLLRTIECEVHDALVSETILETLEVIEDLDIGQGISTTDAMKAAYLAVATECTVKFLVGLMGKPNGKYFEAVDRIWRGRVGILEQSEKSQLVSADLRQRMDEVEAGVWDLRVSKKLSRMNTRNDALRLVAVYVKEALALMGPPFITWAVRLNVLKEVAHMEADEIAVADKVNVGGGPEAGARTENGVNAGDESGLEVQMENGANVGGGWSELEEQMANGINVGDTSELDAQMVNGANVDGGESELEEQMANGINVGDTSELDAQMVNGANVDGGESELEVQMANGTNVGDGSELEEQMVDGTNVSDGSQLEVKTTNGTNVDGEFELEAQTVSGASLSDGSELGVHTVSGTNVGDGSQLEDSQTVDGTNVGNESLWEVQAMNGTNVVGESELEVQPVNGTNMGEGCELEMVKGTNVSYGSELGPQPLQQVRAGSWPPTVSRGLGSNNLVERGSGITDREVHSLADDQVHGEVNDTGVALPRTNRELGLSLAHTTKEIQKSTGLRHKHLAHRRTRGPVKIRDAEDLGNNLSNSKCDSLSTPEINKAQEALKSSILKLQAIVTDPLPVALRLSETVRSDLAMKSLNHLNGKYAGAENPSVEKGAEPVQSNNGNLERLLSSHQNDVPQCSGKEKDAPNLPLDQGKGNEYSQTVDANLGNLSSINQNNVRRPSLMERNTTAHTYEWDDSIDKSQEGTMKDMGRLRLTSPKRNAVSPLKKYENKRFTKRRKVKRWSLLEEDTLRIGVQKYGVGNWKYIFNAYREIFEGRTETFEANHAQVDLKDKWRNMTK